MKTPPNKTTHAHHPTKSIRVLFHIVTGGCLLGALPVSAQYQQFAFPEIAATIRSDNSNVDEAAAGYQMVKYNTSTSARKAYYQFAIPATANTNNGLDLNFTTAANSRAQHVQVWGLDQAYVGGLNTDIIWSTAQANQTDQTIDNGMLTSGPFTATPLYDFISVNSAGTPFTVHIPAPWGAHLIGGKLILVLATIDDPVNSANGLRLTNSSGSLLYWELGLGAPPSLGAIGDLAALTGKPSTTNSFTVNDPEDGPNALTPTAVSSDEAVVPSANVVFGGTGTDRTVYVLGGTTPGTAEIIVTVTDANGNAAERFFRVTVEPSNEAPVISGPAPTNTLLNTAVAVPFTVEDDATAATNLVVTGVIADYSTNLLESLSFDADPDGTNRTVTVTPVNGASGVGVVTLNVSDSGSKTSTVSFAVMVLPSADAVFCDRFDYPLNEAIVNNSGGLWALRNSSAQNINLRMSQTSQEVWIRPRSGADGISARLVGAPYTPADGAVIFTKFKATWPGVFGDDPRDVVGDSSGAFLLLAPNGTATADTLGMVGTVTNTLDLHRVSVSNGGGTFSPLATTDLALLTPYNIVMRYVVGSAQATLWVNATSESDPSVTATDLQTPANGSYLHLRQQINMGNIYIDDLTVVVVLPPVLTGITPPSGGSVEILFDGGAGATTADFAVEGSATVTGPYGPVSASFTDLGGGAFKAILSGVTGSENFYRVKRNPVQF